MLLLLLLLLLLLMLPLMLPWLPFGTHQPLLTPSLSLSIFPVASSFMSARIATAVDAETSAGSACSCVHRLQELKEAADEVLLINLHTSEQCSPTAALP